MRGGGGGGYGGFEQENNANNSNRNSDSMAAPAEAASPFGLFSPTQEAAPAHVLHSIFSPPQKKKPASAVTTGTVGGNGGILRSSSSSRVSVHNGSNGNKAVRETKKPPPPPPPPSHYRQQKMQQMHVPVTSYSVSTTTSNKNAALSARPAPPPPPSRQQMNAAAATKTTANANATAASSIILSGNHNNNGGTAAPSSSVQPASSSGRVDSATTFHGPPPAAMHASSEGNNAATLVSAQPPQDKLPPPPPPQAQAQANYHHTNNVRQGLEVVREAKGSDVLHAHAHAHEGAMQAPAPAPVGTVANVAAGAAAGEEAYKNNYNSDDYYSSPPPKLLPEAVGVAGPAGEDNNIPRNLHVSIGARTPLASSKQAAVTTTTITAADINDENSNNHHQQHEHEQQNHNHTDAVHVDTALEASALFMSPISVLTEATRSVALPIAFGHDGLIAASPYHGATTGDANGGGGANAATASTANSPTGTNRSSAFHAAAVHLPSTFSSSGASVSATSVVTYNNKIPIEMLNFDYVSNCTGVDELERIVDVLSEESPPRYPSLLRIARNRLGDVLRMLEKKEEGEEREGQQQPVEAESRVIDPDEERSGRADKSPSIPDEQQHDTINDISLACKSESFESAVDPGPLASAFVVPTGTSAAAASAGVDPSLNVRDTVATGAGADPAAFPAASASRLYQRIAPLVLPSGGKRVNFAPPQTGRSLGTPYSELAGFAIVDSEKENQDADSIVMDLSPSSYGGSVRSRLSRSSRASSLRPSVSRGVDSRGSAAATDSRIVEVHAGSSPAAAGVFRQQHNDTSTDASDDELKGNLASVLAEHSMLKSEIDAVSEERDALKVKLASQTVELREFEGHLARQQADFALKTKSLVEAKSRAEAELTALQSAKIDSSDEAKEVMVQLKTREREVLALREEIRLTKEKRRKEFDASSDLHDELLAEIAHCTKELTLQKQRSAEALQSLEIRLSSDFEEIITEQNARIDDLTDHLGESQFEVERLRSQKNDLAKALKAVRTNLRKDSLCSSEKRKEAQEANLKAISAEAAANAMAKALAISEKELVEAVERKDQLERQCRMLQEENSLLLKENKKLSARVQSLNKELADSHSYLDTLNDQVNHLGAAKYTSSEEALNLKEKLLSVERDYAAQLHELESELRDRVPADLYKKAVKDLKKKEDEVTKLSSKLKRAHKSESKAARKIAKDEFTDKENDIPRHVTISIPEKKRPCTKVHEFARRVSPTNSDEVEVKEATKSTSATRSMPTQVCVPVAKGKSLARMKALREAGGEKGLKQKLEKARGRFSSPQ
mmetsp:Transcript_16823/g.36546  ORF Transcript_16823/g.36546 Transcript_16823/m.36546 type:complete len:1305 (+) Transcript_16823:54-3968(+)